MTTTTGGAARVLAWLEEWLQTEWPELEVYCTSVTEHISTIALGVPKSRSLLGELVKDIDLSATAFPFMHSREASIDGIPVRIARISFSGELAFEINVTWGHARYIWEKLWNLGRPYNLTAYVTETMHMLRVEGSIYRDKFIYFSAMFFHDKFCSQGLLPHTIAFPANTQAGIAENDRFRKSKTKLYLETNKTTCEIFQSSEATRKLKNFFRSWLVNINIH